MNVNLKLLFLSTSLICSQVSGITPMDTVCDMDLLPYYPDINAFIKDANKLVEQGKFNWNILIHRYWWLESAGVSLHLTHQKLSSLGFSKKIRSLKGFENLRHYLPLSEVRSLYLHNHEIDDFSFKDLKQVIPNLRSLYLDNNKIIRLHKNQFDELDLDQELILSLLDNEIQDIEADCFSHSTPPSRFLSNFFFFGVNPSLFKNRWGLIASGDHEYSLINRSKAARITIFAIRCFYQNIRHVFLFQNSNSKAYAADNILLCNNL